MLHRDIKDGEFDKTFSSVEASRKRVQELCEQVQDLSTEIIDGVPSIYLLRILNSTV